MNKVSQDASLVAELAFKAYCENLNRRLYLYAGHSEVAIVSEDEKNPPGMELVTGDHIPRNMEFTQLSRWAYNLLMKTPYLSVE